MPFAKSLAVTRIIVGHIAEHLDWVTKVMNGAIQQNHTHKVTNMYHAQKIAIVKKIGNAADHVHFKSKSYKKWGN